ncbi:MAG: hypothetical protein R3C25_05475 [Hyphomonadaceae bacterium]
MSQGVAADVALVLQLYERDPTPENLAALRDYAMRPLRLEIELQRGRAAGDCALQRSETRRSIDTCCARCRDVNRDVWYDSTCPGSQVIVIACRPRTACQLKAYHRDRVQALAGPLFVAWIMGATMFLIVTSIIFIRNQVRPIEAG